MQPLKFERSFTEGGLWPSKRKLYRNSHCQQSCYKTCAHIKMGTTLRSTMMGKIFRIKATLDSWTKNVVYVTECKKYATQYIGETENTLRVRLTGDRSDIHHQRTDRQVARHFCQPYHSIHDLTIMVVDKIHRNNKEYRCRKENHWIKMHHSLIPDGLNINL